MIRVYFRSLWPRRPGEEDFEMRLVNAIKVLLVLNLVLLLGVVGHVAASKGLVPYLSGYAQAQEVNSQFDELDAKFTRLMARWDRMEERDMRLNLINYQRQYCDVKDDPSARAAASLLFDQIEEMRHEYLLLTGNVWTPPECERMR